MIGFIMLAILLVGVVSAGSYSMLMVAEKTSSIIDAQTEKKYMQVIESTISSSLKPYGENGALLSPVDFLSVHAPVYDAGNIVSYDFLTIPKSLGLRSKNSWGIPYVYCPYSGLDQNQTIAEGVIASSLNDSYLVEVFDDNIDDSIDYVLRSNQSSLQYIEDNGVIAIVASMRFGSDIPSCSDIIFDNGNYKFDLSKGNFSGFVKAITRSGVEKGFGSYRHKVNLDDFNSDSKLEVLTSHWQATKPYSFDIELSDGLTREMSSNIEFDNSDSADNKSFVLNGYGTSIDANQKTITFKGMDVLIKDISFFDGVKLNFIDSKVTLQNVSINGDLIFLDSTIDVMDSFSINSLLAGSDALIKLDSSQLKFLSANIQFDVSAGFKKSIAASGSDVSFYSSSADFIHDNSGNDLEAFSITNNSEVLLSENSSLTFNKNGGSLDRAIHVDSSSKLSSGKSDIVFNGRYISGINVLGELFIQDSSVLSYDGTTTNAINIDMGRAILSSSRINSIRGVNYAISMYNMSGLTMIDSEISGASRVNIGVNDISGGFVSGSSTAIYASGSCVISQDGQYGIFGSSLQSVMINKSNWSCL